MSSLFENGADPADIPAHYLHGDQEYVIVSGDTLSELAARYEVKGGWQEIWQDNRDVLGDNPDLIFPGQKITIRFDFS